MRPWLISATLLAYPLFASGRSAGQEPLSAVKASEDAPPPSSLNPPPPPSSGVSSPVPSSPAKTAGAGAKAKSATEKEPKKPSSVWDKLPPAPPLPRIGYFTIPPGGRGYYSLVDVLLDHHWLKTPQTPYPPTASDPISFY